MSPADSQFVADGVATEALLAFTDTARTPAAVKAALDALWRDAGRDLADRLLLAFDEAVDQGDITRGDEVEDAQNAALVRLLMRIDHALRPSALAGPEACDAGAGVCARTFHKRLEMHYRQPARGSA